MEKRLRLLGAVGGAGFTVLVLVAFAIAPGPSSARGVTVVEYYAAHRTATLWQAVLFGFAVVLFMWFTGTFAGAMPWGTMVLAAGATTAALYLVAIGCWESLGETYGDVDITTLPSESYGDAHALYDVGVGATHLANFIDAAFIGATAAGLLTGVQPRRRLAWIGAALTLVHLINAPLQIVASSDWSDAVGAIVFLTYLAWVTALSATLVASLRVPTGALGVAAEP